MPCKNVKCKTSNLRNVIPLISTFYCFESTGPQNQSKDWIYFFHFHFWPFMFVCFSSFDGLITDRLARYSISKFRNIYDRTSINPVKKNTACPLAGESWCLEIYHSFGSLLANWWGSSFGFAWKIRKTIKTFPEHLTNLSWQFLWRSY